MQIQTYLDEVLSKYQCGFCKGFIAQHCLVSMIEKWEESVDNGGECGALMTDPSKAFDCLHHGLVIANLDTYNFDLKSVKSIQQYLSNIRQRSILGPLIFNIFLCDLFYFLEGITVANYADNTIP